MRPRTLLAVSLILLSACGGSKPSNPGPTIPSTSASPTESARDEAIREFCADMTRFGSGTIDTSRIGENIASTLDKLRGWLLADADRIEELGGPAATIKLVRSIGRAAAQEAARVRSTYPPGTPLDTALNAYSEFGRWVDDQKARIPAETCPDLDA